MLFTEVSPSGDQVNLHWVVYTVHSNKYCDRLWVQKDTQLDVLAGDKRGL